MLEVPVSHLQIRLKCLSGRVLSDLHDSFMKPDQCNWKNLVHLMRQREREFFSEEAYCELLQNDDRNPTPFLKFLFERNASVEYLLFYLKLLPCQCTLRTFLRSFYNLMPMITTHQYGDLYVGSSLPAYNVNSPNSLTLSNHLQSLPPRVDSQNDPYVIINQPTGKSLPFHEELILKFNVRPCSGKTYQWYHNYQRLPGQMQNCLMVDDVGVKHQGIYYCIVTSNKSPQLEIRSKEVFVSIGPKDAKCTANGKVALLIANEYYDNHRRLPAASRDVKVLADILQNELNFKTLSFTNLKFLEMHKALKWLRELASKGCYCVFYFGGHGYQNDEKCYMVPTDAPVGYVNSDCVQAHSQLEEIQRFCDPKLMLIALDICRKRNPMELSNSQTNSTFKDNVVFAFATAENREAYERAGEKHGIFVESLRKYLTIPKRVDHMLLLMQNDIGRTADQFSEIRSMLSEDRCLTDPIKPLSSNLSNITKVYKKWLQIHDLFLKHTLIEFSKSGTTAELQYESVLTNKLKVSVRIKDPGETQSDVCIDPNYITECKGLLVSTEDGFAYDPAVHTPRPKCLQISNLQNLKGPLKVKVALCYQQPGTRKWYKQTCIDQISLNFVKNWNT